MGTINAYVSDLFFNLDHSEAVKRTKKNVFDGYDEDMMTQQAVWFCDAIAKIGGEQYTPDQIIADFQNRL